MAKPGFKARFIFPRARIVRRKHPCFDGHPIHCLQWPIHSRRFQHSLASPWPQEEPLRLIALQRHWAAPCGAIGHHEPAVRRVRSHWGAGQTDTSFARGDSVHDI